MDSDAEPDKGFRLKWRKMSHFHAASSDVRSLDASKPCGALESLQSHMPDDLSPDVRNDESAGQPATGDDAPEQPSLWPNSPQLDTGCSSQYSASVFGGFDFGNSRPDVGGVSSFQDDNAAVHHVHMSGLSRTGIVLPWETPLMRQIFGDDRPSLGLSMPLNWGQIPDPFPESSTKLAAPDVPDPGKWTCARCVKHVSDETYIQQRDKTLKGALAKWRFLVMLDKSASDVGRQLLDADSDTVDSVLTSVMGVKSPNTVLKRANAVMLFYRWHAVHGLQNFLPFSETDVWRYVMFQTTSASSASRSQSLLQALRFCHFVMGFDKALECASSRRVVGQSQIQLAGKAPSRQARPLTVQEVQRLHGISDGVEHSAVDRCIASGLLLALYGRCRVSDLGYIHEILHDLSGGTGFIEVTTRFHKAARSAQQKAMLLPIVISSAGVQDPPWVQSWIKNRKECGLPTSGIVKGALLPAPMFGEKAEWSARPLSTGEVTSILKGFLKSDDQDLSSHSLKATTLSWAAKGEMLREHRRILGRHAATVQGSDSFYSRDMSVGPVNALQKLINLIKAGQFTPDATRSNYFPHGSVFQPGTPAHVVMQPFTPAFPRTGQPGTPCAAPVDGTCEAEAEAQDGGAGAEVKTEAGWSLLEPGVAPSVINLSSDSESESSESGTCEESCDDDEVAEQRDLDDDDVEVMESPAGFSVTMPVLAKNMRTKVVHECRDRTPVELFDEKAFHDQFDDSVTLCGRTVTKYFSLVQMPFDWTAKCRVCFKGRRAP